MPKFLIQGSYSSDGLKGLLKEGGTGRKTTLENLARSLGGNIEGLYYAFGEDDVYVIGEFPDNVTAAAVCIAAGASGAVRTKTVLLLTPEEIDQAARKSVDYRPPGA
ncbi:MAG TPA: GYD domain-containing protein [Candidatus Dormibacteraeota bacterium]|nr:GYD domain-containing protein [Candidatus Dormibacteraeota bacterium]